MASARMRTNAKAMAASLPVERPSARTYRNKETNAMVVIPWVWKENEVGNKETTVGRETNAPRASPSRSRSKNVPPIAKRMVRSESAAKDLKKQHSEAAALISKLEDVRAKIVAGAEEKKKEAAAAEAAQKAAAVAAEGIARFKGKWIYYGVSPCWRQRWRCCWSRDQAQT